MKFCLIIPLLLAACAAEPEQIFTPVAVDVPVPAQCTRSDIPRPPDVMSELPNNASLTQFTKACAQQILFDRGYIGELEAALGVK